MRPSYDNSAYVEAKSKLPKPDGKHCIICGKDLPKFFRKYCSPECWYQWYHNLAPPRYWTEIREKVLVRDNRTCQKCGKKELKDEEADIDHIIAISLGGRMWDMDNLQTLCEECHIEKTRKDLEALAVQRGVESSFKDFYDLMEVREKSFQHWNLFKKDSTSCA